MKKVCLLILDGFGLAEAWGGNAITLARMPYWKNWWQKLPHCSLAASGQAVGLPGHEIGNSEVGHLTIGAGRIVPHDSARINQMISDGTFYDSDVILDAINKSKSNNQPLHLMGLLSDAGVHASVTHLEALLEMAKKNDLNEVYLHLFTDGRDTPSDHGIVLIDRIISKMNALGIGKIATISGRYFAMDRDSHWERIKRAVDCLTLGIGNHSNSPFKVLSNSYSQKLTDEFIVPTFIVKEDGQPVGLIKNGESVIFFNFRSDRARQISQMLLQNLPNLFLVTFTPYGFNESSNFKGKVYPAFEPQEIKDGLTSILSQNNIPQLHLAETEKYAHITYFLNVGVEKLYAKEDRQMVASPRIATYNLKPEMSAKELTNKIVYALRKSEHQLIVANYANADMVGHTGDINASITALEFLDTCLGEVEKMAFENDWHLAITADHGNVEQMVNPMDGSINPEHTRNPVPFLIIPPKDNSPLPLKPQGGLSDVAPTILDLLELSKPEVMTGQSLLIK